jgi:hypothetical protein
MIYLFLGYLKTWRCSPKKYSAHQCFVALHLRNTHKTQGGNSQNFLGKFIRFFVTLDLKIMRLFRLKVLFEATIIY